MIDIGLNLASSQFAHDRDQIISDAIKSKVTGFILTGTTIDSSRKVLSYSKDNPEMMVCTSGIHPNYSNMWNDTSKDDILSMASEKNVVAVGECGLDYCGNRRPSRSIQKKVFEEQLKIASDINKPVFLHLRPDLNDQNSVLNDFVEIYEKYKVPGVVHCFTGNKDLLTKILDYGLYVGITGWITDNRRGKHVQELVKLIPHDKIMIETDAPYLTPYNVPKEKYNRRNTPNLLPYVAEAVADHMGIDTDYLCKITDENVYNLFFKG